MTTLSERLAELSGKATDKQWSGGLAGILDEAAAQIAKLQADGDKLAGALDRSRQGWENVLELGLLPVQHQSTALGLQEAATQALTEWKDRP